MLSNDGIQWSSFSGSRFWLDLIGDFQSFRRVAAATMQFLWPCLLFAPSTFANFLASNAIPSINVPGSSSPKRVGARTCELRGLQGCAQKSVPVLPCKPRSSQVLTPTCYAWQAAAWLGDSFEHNVHKPSDSFWAGLPKRLGQRCCHFQSPPGP